MWWSALNQSNTDVVEQGLSLKHTHTHTHKCTHTPLGPTESISVWHLLARIELNTKLPLLNFQTQSQFCCFSLLLACRKYVCVCVLYCAISLLVFHLMSNVEVKYTCTSKQTSGIDTVTRNHTHTQTHTQTVLTVYQFLSNCVFFIVSLRCFNVFFYLILLLPSLMTENNFWTSELRLLTTDWQNPFFPLTSPTSPT